MDKVEEAESDAQASSENSDQPPSGSSATPKLFGVVFKLQQLVRPSCLSELLSRALICCHLPFYQVQSAMMQANEWNLLRCSRRPR